MGILQRLFGAKRPPAEHVDAPTVSDWSSVVPDLVKLSGTTTIGREAIAAFVQRCDPDDTGYIEAVGSLQREPNNPVDPHAVAVFAQAERIGYLPVHVAKALELSPQGSRPVRLQIFTQLLEKGLRAEAWCWLGEGGAGLAVVRAEEAAFIRGCQAQRRAPTTRPTCERSAGRRRRSRRAVQGWGDRRVALLAGGGAHQTAQARGQAERSTCALLRRH